LQNARAFLSAVLPWPTGDEPGYCNLHWKSISTPVPGPNGELTAPKVFWGGRAYRSVDEMMKGLAWGLRQPDIKDIYVCMSSQARCEDKTSARGFAYKNAIRFQQFALKLKSIYIDVDVKDGAYATTEDALAATQAFLAHTGLPLPTAFVATGSGGFHCHWVLTRELTPAEWNPIAFAMAGAVQKFGLIADTQCTIDSARILRVPDTWNNKTDVPKPTSLMAMSGEVFDPETLAGILAPFKGVYNAPPPPLPPGKSLTPVGNDELGGGIGGSAPINIDVAAQNCPFINEALTTGGAGYSNPLWFLTTCIATFAVDGRAAAHRMADGHSGYSQETTDELYDRVEEMKKVKDIGWPKCAKINASGYTGCASCPARPLNKSPLNFAVPLNLVTAADAAADPAQAVPPPAPQTLADMNMGMPSGYFRDQNGMIYRTTMDDAGNQIVIPVFPYPMLDAWLQDNPWVLHFSTRIHTNRLSKIECPLGEMAGKDGVAKVFGRQGMLLKDKGANILREFLVAWIQKLQQSRDLVVSSTPFGWSTTPNSKLEGFTYAGKVWCKDFSRPAAAADPVLASQYSPRGDITPWMTCSRIITDQHRPALDAILASAFAAPLVRFTGREGLLMSTYSPESGIGKSTALRVAQAVWGHPIKSVQSLSDTPNSVIKKMGDIKELPMYWDELKTEADTDRFVNMTFQLAGGKERSRLNSDISQRDPGTWQTMLVTASNDSLIDPMQRATKSTTAGIFRIFEYVVPPGSLGQVQPGYVARCLNELNDNYGQPGLAYAQFIGANHEQVALQVGRLQDKLNDFLKAGNDERYWIATIAVILSGAMYANELGLTQIDIPPLRNFLLGIHEAMRAEIAVAPTDMKNKMSVANILSQFLNAMNPRHTLITNRIHVGQGKPALGSIVIQCDPTRLDSVRVQYGTEDRLLRISSTFLSSWLGEHEYSRHAVTKALAEDFGVKRINGRLGSGTIRVGYTEYLLELSLDDPQFKGIYDDA
jgi:hypothetical protein